MNQFATPDLLAWRDAAVMSARLGGEVTLEWFRRRGLAVERKADTSPVTDADRAAERAIVAELAARFPDHSVVGEESGEHGPASRFRWYIDPIDGTKSFIRGVPLYTTLVALTCDDEPIAAAIYAPATGELACAARGLGAIDERGEPLSVSGTERLEDAWLLTTDPADFLRRRPTLAGTLLARSRSVRTWADAYGYMLVARGHADAMIDPVMSAWDIAPLAVVIREAGGVFTDLSGVRNDLGTSAVAAATPALHAEIMAAAAQSSP